jgi:ABC-type glycerol-3-phosphate transport system substrate-binding protein
VERKEINKRDEQQSKGVGLHLKVVDPETLDRQHHKNMETSYYGASEEMNSNFRAWNKAIEDIKVKLQEVSELAVQLNELVRTDIQNGIYPSAALVNDIKRYDKYLRLRTGTSPFTPIGDFSPAEKDEGFGEN